jgi:hypothetical protein
MMPIPFIQVYKSYRIKSNLIYLQNEKKVVCILYALPFSAPTWVGAVNIMCTSCSWVYQVDLLAHGAFKLPRKLATLGELEWALLAHEGPNWLRHLQSWAHDSLSFLKRYDCLTHFMRLYFLGVGGVNYLGQYIPF